MGYQEKRVWILFGSQFLIYAVYFWTLHHRALHLADTVKVVTALVILQVLLQSLLAITSKPERRDERDIAIERAGYQSGYFTLAAAGVLMIYTVWQRAGEPHAGAFFLINTLLFVLALGELAKLTTQLVLYRKQA